MLTLRKTVTYTETVLVEGGKAAPTPLQFFAAAAVIVNPWFGRGFVEDLSPEIRSIAPQLGEMLTKEIIRMTGSGAAVEAYGKAAVVGTSGEVEHACALIHTLRFGNHYRKAVDAETYLPATNIRSGANAPIVIPLLHKGESGRRSHFLTLHFAISDAPAHDEIVIALGASIGGHPHHRIGDRYQDLKELGGNTAT